MQGENILIKIAGCLGVLALAQFIVVLILNSWGFIDAGNELGSGLFLIGLGLISVIIATVGLLFNVIKKWKK
jgi:hypothetical protein|tara:strand:- start:357 stop:572 length:216 start_codon:yes stop_codon:yes gene_type:complete